MGKYTVGLLALAGLLTVGFFWSPRNIAISIQPNQEFQTMSGWEVTLRLWETNKKEDRYDDSWESHSDEIFGRLVNELGINRVRLEIKSGVENPVDYWQQFEDGKIGYLEYKKHYYHKINDNDDPQTFDPLGFQFSMLDFQVEKMLLPIKKLVEANGEKLFVNFCYVDFKGNGPQGSLSHALDSEEYAELIEAAFSRLDTKYGITPDALEIILEPDNSVDWRGEQIGHGLVASAARLDRAGYDPEYIAPSTAHPSRAPEYLDAIMSVPGARQELTTLAYHRYGATPDFIALPPIRSRAEEYGLQTAMLEHLGSDAIQLHADLTETNISAWQQYGIAVRIREDHVLRYGYFYGLKEDKNGDQYIVLSESGQNLKHYFKYIRRGAVRVGAKSSGSDHRVVAFRNMDDSHVVVVHSLREAVLSIQDLPAGSYGVFLTTSGKKQDPLPDVDVSEGVGFDIAIPESSTLTLFQKRPAATEN